MRASSCGDTLMVLQACANAPDDWPSYEPRSETSRSPLDGIVQPSFPRRILNSKVGYTQEKVEQKRISFTGSLKQQTMVAKLTGLPLAKLGLKVGAYNTRHDADFIQYRRVRGNSDGGDVVVEERDR